MEIIVREIYKWLDMRRKKEEITIKHSVSKNPKFKKKGKRKK
jgi:hypothetical protein